VQNMAVLTVFQMTKFNAFPKFFGRYEESPGLFAIEIIQMGKYSLRDQARLFQDFTNILVNSQ